MKILYNLLQLDLKTLLVKSVIINNIISQFLQKKIFIIIMKYGSFYFL